MRVRTLADTRGTQSHRMETPQHWPPIICPVCKVKIRWHQDDAVFGLQYPGCRATLRFSRFFYSFIVGFLTFGVALRFTHSVLAPGARIVSPEYRGLFGEESVPDLSVKQKVKPVNIPP